MVDGFTSGRFPVLVAGEFREGPCGRSMLEKASVGSVEIGRWSLRFHAGSCKDREAVRRAAAFEMEYREQQQWNMLKIISVSLPPTDTFTNPATRPLSMTFV